MARERGADAVDVVVAKLTKCGTLRETRRVATDLAAVDRGTGAVDRRE